MNFVHESLNVFFIFHKIRISPKNTELNQFPELIYGDVKYCSKFNYVVAFGIYYSKRQQDCNCRAKPNGNIRGNHLTLLEEQSNMRGTVPGRRQINTFGNG